jgi:capsular exopolysaccharide synthesis family protein
MIQIQRKLDVNNTVYTFLLEKRAEAGIAKASTIEDNRIIDKAYPFNSSRIRPKTRQNYMMALVAGLFIPFVLIIVVDLLNNKILDKKDIERGTTVPIIGYISHNYYDSEVPLKDHPGATIAESFRSIRTNLKYLHKDVSNPVIAVSSTISSEGKTFISVNLATIYAMLGKRVLLVGLDMRRPRIHKVLDISSNVGMSTYLSGQSSLDEIIFSTGVENLFYISSGPVAPNPAELIESEEMSRFIARAREMYDMIIIDTPPLAIVTDALLLAPLADTCLLVIRQRYTSRNTLSLIQELHENHTFRRMAIIVNDISVSGYYGYGLRYGYSLGYSYGYNYYDQHVYGRYGPKGKSGVYYTE